MLQCQQKFYLAKHYISHFYVMSSQVPYIVLISIEAYIFCYIHRTLVFHKKIHLNKFSTEKKWNALCNVNILIASYLKGKRLFCLITCHSFIWFLCSTAIKKKYGKKIEEKRFMVEVICHHV